MKSDIILKIKKAGLSGRGGGCFPTAKKWEMVQSAKGGKKYVICNASEGEPGVNKDFYILNNFPNHVVNGMSIAMDFLGAEKGFIYINPEYHKKLQKSLKQAVGKAPIEIFKKADQAGYIGGEETSALNHIEGKRIEPRLRPPYPTSQGLWGSPTLINNVETFYNVSLVAAGEYEKKRFYTINGDCLWTGVYEYPENWTIEKILKETDNYPDFDFFVQSGGDGSGEVLGSTQLRRETSGSASITVYSVIKHNAENLIRNWLEFFLHESCGQCTPCREGTYRLRELLMEKETDWQMFSAILDNLSESSFCGLGCAAPIAVTSYVENVLSKLPDNKIKISPAKRKMICECFS